MKCKQLAKWILWPENSRTVFHAYTRSCSEHLTNFLHKHGESYVRESRTEFECNWEDKDEEK